MTIHSDNINIGRPSHLGGGSWGLTGLTNITVLFGKNGSGKSILLRAWRDTDVPNIHYIIPERIGTLEFQPNFMAEQINPQQRKDRSTTNFSDSYRQQIISRIQGYFISRGASRTNELKGNPNELEELLTSLLPDFTISLRGQNPPYLLKRLSNGEEITNINALSSGESQLLTIALDVLTISAIWDIEEKAKRIILIDEPDAHLHPDLQVRFADFLIGVTKKFKIQFVVATHSTTLLSALGQFGNDKTSVIYLLKAQSNYVAQKFSDNLKELSACLGGHVLMGPLFGAPLLLVEGDDDYRVWSQVPRHGQINLAVIPCNGDEIKNYQKLLEKLFASISEPKILGHSLLDGDKGLPQPNENSTQNYIKFIKLDCHECENLFLTNEVLTTLGLTWEQAKEKLTADASNYGNKKEIIESLVAADRKTFDVKRIINEVGKILDNKNVHWTTRLGNKLGKERPTGQLAEFLGEQVVNSLWGAV